MSLALPLVIHLQKPMTFLRVFYLCKVKLPHIRYVTYFTNNQSRSVQQRIVGCLPSRIIYRAETPLNHWAAWQRLYFPAPYS